MSLPLAAAVSAGVTWIAWRAGTLSNSGGLAAWTVGLLVLHGTGWKGGAVLAVFFISSNLVSRIGPFPSLLDPKGDRRDAWQVYANGAPAAVVSVLSPDMGFRIWLLTASLAAAAADTWATSVGSLSRVPPRLFWSGVRVPAGTSGGVTLAGFVGAATGALLISSIGALVSGRWSLLAAGTLIGFLGMLIDSLAGGLIQGRFYCPTCNQPSEWRAHRCGGITVQRGGLRWFSNDGVNLLATTLSVLAAWTAWWWLD